MVKHWDCSNVMGSSCPINLVTGMRGFGKTYAMKKQGIKAYIKRGATWSYVRYNEPMIERVLKMGSFFGDIVRNDEFEDYLLKNEGTSLYIAEKCKHPKWEKFGSMVALSSFDSYKGASTPKMELMHFDEFIKEREKRNVPYPPGAVNAFWNLYDTFDRRENRLRVVMTANAADLVNPFFRAWKIKPIPKGSTAKFQVGRKMVFYENAYSEEYAKWARSSDIGAYTFGSSYDDYSIGNEFANSNGLFIRKRPENSYCQMGIKWGDELFGVWCTLRNGDSFVTNKVSKDAETIVLSHSDLTPDYILLDRKAPYLKWLVKAYSYGQLYFDKDATRENFLDMLALCGLK